MTMLSGGETNATTRRARFEVLERLSREAASLRIFGAGAVGARRRQIGALLVGEQGPGAEVDRVEPVDAVEGGARIVVGRTGVAGGAEGLQETLVVHLVADLELV